MTRVPKAVVQRYLRDVTEALEVVKGLTSRRLEELLRDRYLCYSLRYAVVVMVEASADLALAIIEKDFGETAESYREAFLKLAEHGVISGETANAMVKLVALRNLVVHRYWVIDDARIYGEAKRGGVAAVERFLDEVMAYVEAEEG